LAKKKRVEENNNTYEIEQYINTFGLIEKKKPELIDVRKMR